MARVKARALGVGALVALAAVGAASCGSGLRTVELGPRPLSAPKPIPISEAPPLHKVETVPKDPGAPCVWLDGRWEWVDRTWEWTPGAWVLPPPGCHFALAETTWATQGESGQLFYFPGRWYPDAETGAACAAPRACDGSAPRSP
ncbi:MAG TPA: hypothetical protein VHE30_28420 [Polyangiaceae bacterium]|nr:hypothetical protein [Polyangiaceae bacterium]